MSVTVTGIGETRDMLQRVERFLASTKPMAGLTEEVAEIVKKKTERGIDYTGRRFEPYSDGYRKQKGSSRVNLRKSGKMLGAITSKIISARHGRVYVKPRGYPRGRATTEMVAQIHNTGTGKQPRREFMNLTKSAVAKLKKKYFDDPIMKILGRR